MRLESTDIKSFLWLPGDARGPATRLILALSGQDRADLMDLLAAVRRADQRRESDQVTDQERRVLVGPRLPRWQVDRYRRAASASGQSLYRWATDALEQHLADKTGCNWCIGYCPDVTGDPYSNYRHCPMCGRHLRDAQEGGHSRGTE